LPFSVPRQTPRTLLFYLASRESAVSRSELLVLFWPEETEPTARLRLRETLNKLKQGLPDDNLLVSREEYITLDFEHTYVDLLEFNELTTQIGQIPWKIPLEEPLPEPLYLLLTQAYQLWRGSTFLAGAKLSSTPFLDAWFSNIANNNENLYQRIAERLSDHEAATGNLEKALLLARQLVLHHELEEEVHARVLRLMIQIGLIKDARAYYKEVQSRFQTETNSQLGSELMELYHQIRSDTHPFSTQEKIHWNIHSSMQVPFVGRQKQLIQLRQAYQRGGGVILLGESGIGKTRLLQEFYSQLQPLPRLFLAKCRPTESDMPFQPFIDVLRQNTLPKEWLSLPRVWANHLQMLFPELINLRSDLSPVLLIGLEQARSLLFEALRQLFLILCKSQRLLLILDDGQWADEASQNTIMYLQGRSPFDKQAFSIIAARQDEPNPLFEKHIALSKTQVGAVILQLPQMDLNEVHTLSHQVIGASLSPRFVERLAQETGGNPFFILETLLALIKQQPVLDPEKLSTLPLAESISSLVQERFQTLSPRAISIIGVAALIGSEFSTNSLTQVSDLQADEVALALDELVERSLIARSGQPDQPHQYRFIHDQFREVALLNINPLRAQIIHRKIAFALLKDENERLNQSAILAYHFEAAEEWCLAYEYWIIAGQRARQLYAISGAFKAFKNAENLIERCWGMLNEQQIYALYKDWGEMAYAINDTITLQAINITLMKLGERLQSPLLKGTALVRLGNACFSSGQLEKGLEHTHAAVDLLSTTNNIYQLTNARANLGVFYYMAGHVTEAIQVLESASEVVKNKDDRDLIFLHASLNYELGICMFLNGQPQKSLEFGLQSLRDYNAINNLEGITSAYSELSLASYYLGSYSQGFHYNELGIEGAGQSQSWRLLGYLYDYRAMLEHVTGNLDAMLEYVEQAVELGRGIGQVDTYTTGYRLISDVFYLMGDYEKSLEYIKLAYVENQKSFIAIDILYRMRLILFTLDRKEERLIDLKEMIHSAQLSGLITGKLLAQIALMLAYQDLQQWEDARNLANDIKANSLSRGFRAFVITANLILANCEWQAGHQNTALDLVSESIQEAESLPIVWLEMSGRVLFSIFMKQTGQPAEANYQRLTRLIQNLHHNCQKSLFKPSLQAYTNRIEQLLT
jgi:DNA-binding SARP family transcriptional activator/tetratricopeptide (TPR) repeat protein